MAIKKILVGGADGTPEQLQPGDTPTGQAIATVADGATITLDVSTTTRFIVSSLAGNRTVVFSNTVDGAQFWLTVGQDATGGRTLTWPTGIRWFGGASGVPLATANKLTQFAFVRIASGSYYGFQANES